MKRSLITRVLHAVLAIAIVHQLIVSWLMERPRPGGAGGNLAFDLHETVGLASLGILILFWIWTAVRRQEYGIAALLPWFSPARRGAVLDDARDHARSLMRRRIPDAAEEKPLASAVHGLGLLIASAMAGTGTVVYALMAPDGSLAGVGGLALELHGVLANIMWAYLIGHAGIAVAHQFAGHRVLDRMLFNHR